MDKHPPQQARQIDAELVLTGKLLGHAHACVRPIDHVGHFAPALCFDVLSADGQRSIKVEQFFPQGQDDACKAAAANMRKGDMVTFQVAPANMHHMARGVSNVMVTKPAAATQTEHDMFAMAEAKPTAVSA